MSLHKTSLHKIFAYLIVTFLAGWLFFWSASHGADGGINDLLDSLIGEIEEVEEEADKDDSIVWKDDNEEKDTDNKKTNKDNDNEGDNKEDEDHDSAEDILNNVSDDDWKYDGTDEPKIKIVETKEQSATFETTKVLFKWKDVDTYRVYYSENTLATEKLSSIRDMEVKSSPATDKKMVSLTLKSLKPDTTYHVVVSPVHPDPGWEEPLTMITEEINFKTTSTVKKEEPKEEPSPNTAKEESKKVEPAKTNPNAKPINNVSYTYAENVVSLKWTPSTEAEMIEVNLRHPGDTSYTKVWSPKLNSWVSNFNVNKAGNYFLKLKAMTKDGKQIGKDHIQTVKVDKVTDSTETNKPVVTNPPKVGPTTDIMIWLLIFAMVIYMIWRFRKIER